MIITVCARLRPGQQLGDPEHATKTALRRLARRHQFLTEEIVEADVELAHLVSEVAPALLTLSASGQRLPASSSPAPGTILSGSHQRPRLPVCAGSHPSPPAVAASSDPG